MQLEKFINSISFEILGRGQNYFENGYVEDLEKRRNGDWHAEIEGNYGVYEVTLKMDNEDNVTGYSCDCPYDGAICKHIAALAIAVNDKDTLEIATHNKPEKESWEKLIQQAKLQELRNFMLDYGDKNKDFRHQIRLAFSEPKTVENEDNIPYYKNQISSIFENYSHYGFIDYHSSSSAMYDVDHFFNKIAFYRKKNNLNEVFCIAAAIIEESAQAITNMDDSNGECGDSIYQAFEILRELMDETSPVELKSRIFDWLYIQVQNPIYNDYGVGDGLEPMFFDTAIKLGKLPDAYRFIEKKLKELEKKDGWSKKYYTENYLLFKIDLLQSEGKSEEAENLIDEHIYLDKFRKIRVEQSIAKNDLEQAEKLLIEGIKIAENDRLPGVAHDWKKILLDVYKKTNPEKFSTLSHELFTEHTHDLKYYKNYKSTIPKKEWEEKRNLLITELKKQKRGYYQGIPLDDMAAVYIEEEMIDKLFELVSSSNSISSIIRYTDKLKHKYSDELLRYYQTAIEKKAQNTGRSVYEALVEYLMQMAKLKGGQRAAKNLRNKLLEKYKNRPAMKEIFGRLNWK